MQAASEVCQVDLVLIDLLVLFSAEDALLDRLVRLVVDQGETRLLVVRDAMHIEAAKVPEGAAGEGQHVAPRLLKSSMPNFQLEMNIRRTTRSHCSRAGQRAPRYRAVAIFP